jgi:peptide/nickel transport system permease protein
VGAGPRRASSRPEAASAPAPGPLSLWRSFGRHAPTLGVIANRVAWALPTLFGISLVTFALVQLAPGEPGVAGQVGSLRSDAVQQESSERLRRTYGFDLPLFFNAAIEDRGRRVRGAIADLGRDETSPLAERKLLRMTTLAVPELAKALSGAGRGEPRQRLRRVLDRILEVLRVPERETLARGPASGYEEWWRSRQDRFAAGAIRAAVGRLRQGADGAMAEVLLLHQRAVPALLESYLSSGASDDERRRLSQALSEITGHVVIYDGKAPLAERRSALGQWRDWWRSEETVYQDLTRGERLTGFFTRTQYARWLSRLLSGDFGESSYFRRRAWDVISERLPVTLWLNLAALLLAYLAGIPLGVFSAARRGSPVDRTIGVGLLLLYSLPVYWVGLVLVTTLGGLEGAALFPSGGLRSFRPEDAPLGSAWLDVAWHAALPVLCLAYGALAVVSRYQRAGMVEVLGQDYIRTARSKGLGEGRVIWRHGLPNGALPVINLLGLQVPFLLSGSVIVETIFDLPGLGSLALLAIHQHDTNVLMGLISLTAVLTLGGLLLADLLMIWVDPRIGLGRREVA